MSFTSFKEQFKNVILEYLSPEAYKARLGNSADMVTRDQANSRYLANAVRQGAKDHPRRKIVQNQAPIKGRWQARNQIDDLSKTRSDRVSKVKQGRRGGGNSKLQRKGFDDNRAVGPNKPRPATLKLGKTLGIEEQFKNAVLKYLDEWTAEGVWKAAEKRGERDIYDEDGNIIDVTSKSDKARTTTVTKDPKTGEVVVDRHDKTNKPPRTTTDKLAKGEKLTPAEAATADRRRNRSVSDSRNKRVIKP
tara:strand:+ start:105 stop:848 length:744 start_codon:yes stop_codon:yes gene_type:complete